MNRSNTLGEFLPSHLPDGDDFEALQRREQDANLARLKGRPRRAPTLLGRALPMLRAAGTTLATALWLVTHNTMAMVGVFVLGVALLVYSRPDLRDSLEQRAYGWLHERHGVEGDEPVVAVVAESITASPAQTDATAVQRATATDVDELPRGQAAVANWIARRYKVAPEPIGRLVQEAWDVGTRLRVEPTLILAIMAVESSFNPFAQSAVGAQGLMQVMTHLHDKKYEPFGGNHAAFDPVTNLKVGVQVLQECIARAGNLYDGLRYYVGAANLPTDGGYAGKVLAEHQNLQQVAAGKRLAPNMPLVPVTMPAKPKAGTDPSPATESPAERSSPRLETVPALEGPSNAQPAPEPRQVAKVETNVRLRD